MSHADGSPDMHVSCYAILSSPPAKSIPPRSPLPVPDVCRRHHSCVAVHFQTFAVGRASLAWRRHSTSTCLLSSTWALCPPAPAAASTITAADRVPEAGKPDFFSLFPFLTRPCSGAFLRSFYHALRHTSKATCTTLSCPLLSLFCIIFVFFP